MANVNLKSKITLDDTAFMAGLRRISTGGKRLTSAVSKRFAAVGRSIAKTAGTVAKFAAKIAVAGAALAALALPVGLTKGLKRAFDLGSELAGLSSRTGVAVKDLSILQQAFRDVGVEGDEVGDILNDMQEKIVESVEGTGDAAEGLGMLNLTFKDLASLDPAKQFDIITKRIAALKTPAERTTAAMKIFSDAGAKLLPMFNDSGALDRASVTVGKQAELLEKNAAVFDRVADLLNSVGTKFQGFIVGVADKLMSEILPLMEKFNEYDFTGLGQRLGQSLGGPLASAISTLGKFGDILASGNFKEYLSLSMQIAGKNLINWLGKAAQGFGSAMSTILTQMGGRFSNHISRTFSGGGILAGFGMMIAGTLINAAAKFIKYVGANFNNIITGAVITLAKGFSGVADVMMSVIDKGISSLVAGMLRTLGFAKKAESVKRASDGRNEGVPSIGEVISGVVEAGKKKFNEKDPGNALIEKGKQKAEKHFADFADTFVKEMGLNIKALKDAGEGFKNGVNIVSTFPEQVMLDQLKMDSSGALGQLLTKTSSMPVGGKSPLLNANKKHASLVKQASFTGGGLAGLQAMQSRKALGIGPGNNLSSNLGGLGASRRITQQKGQDGVRQNTAMSETNDILSKNNETMQETNQILKDLQVSS